MSGSAPPAFASLDWLTIRGRPVAAGAPAVYPAATLGPVRGREVHAQSLDAGLDRLVVGADALALGVVHPRQVLHLHHRARVLRQHRLVAQQEVPVQRGVGAGARAGALGGLEAATAAVVAHAVDVLAAGHVRLAGEASAVGMQRHAGDVHVKPAPDTPWNTTRCALPFRYNTPL